MHVNKYIILFFLFQQVTSDSLVCHACWTRAWNVIRQPTSQPSTNPIVGHVHVCISCGTSLLRQRSYSLNIITPRVEQIRNVIADQIAPQQVKITNYTIFRILLNAVRLLWDVKKWDVKNYIGFFFYSCQDQPVCVIIVGEGPREQLHAWLQKGNHQYQAFHHWTQTLPEHKLKYKILQIACSCLIILERLTHNASVSFLDVTSPNDF